MILKKIFSKLGNGQPAENFINLRISISELSKVWQNKVSKTTIRNCFKYLGFSDNPIQEECETMNSVEECWNQWQVKGIINENIPLDEFLRVDKNVIVDEYPTDDEILYSVKNEDGEDKTAKQMMKKKT